MLLRIELLEEKKMAGLRIEMSLSNNQTMELWQGFGPRQKEIRNRVSSLRYAVQVYDKGDDVKGLTPHTLFDMWAAVEVNGLEEIPDGLEGFEIEKGLYAVFLHKGLPSEFSKTWRYITGSWLPTSGYELDNRPHFQAMGPDYRPTDPLAEEEVWVPVRPRK